MCDTKENSTVFYSNGDIILGLDSDVWNINKYVFNDLFFKRV